MRNFEVCFTAKLQRKGITKWLEAKKIIKERTEGFAVIVRGEDIDYISSNERNHVCNLENLKVNNLK